MPSNRQPAALFDWRAGGTVNVQSYAIHTYIACWTHRPPAAQRHSTPLARTQPEQTPVLASGNPASSGIRGLTPPAVTRLIERLLQTARDELRLEALIREATSRAHFAGG